MNKRYQIENVRHAPIWWRHGPVIRLCESNEVVGYEIDLFLEHSDSYDIENVLKQLENIEKKYLTKWPFLDPLDEDEFRFKLDTLPTEFFSHQLSDVDLCSEESLFNFLCKWGFPYSPARNDKSCLENYGSISSESLEGIHETEEILKEGSVLRICISRKEAVSTIRAFQTIVEMMFDSLKGGKDIPMDMGPINAASCNPFYLIGWPSHSEHSLKMTRLADRGMLTCAIANQIIATISDPLPWKKCRCDGCKVMFKRKQSGRGNPDSKSIYCSTKCEQRQCKRNQRAAAKNRIKH